MGFLFMGRVSVLWLQPGIMPFSPSESTGDGGREECRASKCSNHNGWNRDYHFQVVGFSRPTSRQDFPVTTCALVLSQDCSCLPFDGARFVKVIAIPAVESTVDCLGSVTVVTNVAHLSNLGQLGPASSNILWRALSKAGTSSIREMSCGCHLEQGG